MAAIGVATMRTRYRLRAAACFALAVACASHTGGALAAEPAEEAPEVDAVAARLVMALDDDRAPARHAAFVELSRLAEEPAAAPRVRTAIHEALQTADSSFEARRSLQRLVEKYPAAAKRAVASPPTEAELVEWLSQATSDDYGLRLAADAKLKTMFSKPETLGSLLTVIKSRLADATLSTTVRGELTDLWKRTRYAWMATDPAHWNMPPVSDEQIDKWLDDLQTPGEPVPTWRQVVARDQAERELSDLLLRDEYAAKVSAKLKERLYRQGLAADVITRLEQLNQWCKPALVAEIWMLGDAEGELVYSRGSTFPLYDAARAKRSQVTMQFLLIGVPWKTPGDPSEKSSHFDYIDDDRVHCAEGYTLTPGNYPVGVAFPHPLNPETCFFHIMNLATPRRRMMFERALETGYDTEADQARRLKEITQRTCDGFLNGKRELSRELVRMLATLDPQTVSQFAVKYLSMQPAPKDSVVQREIDGVLCQIVGAYGTPEVLPGLVAAIDAGRLRAASDDQPFHRGWLAALAVAERNDWPGKDEWLAGVVERTDRLLADQTPDIGATAAAMLIGRHNTEPTSFKLSTPQLDPLQLTELTRINSKLKCWSFGGVDERRAVIGWWEGQKNALEAKHRNGADDPVR